MEFLEDECRPRFVFQSRSVAPSSVAETDQISSRPSYVFLSISVSIALVLASFSIFYFQWEPLKFLLSWFSLSLLIGPFAPSSLTGGNIRVGHGRLIEPEHEAVVTDVEAKKKSVNKRSKSHKPDYPPECAVQPGRFESGLLGKEGKTTAKRISKDEHLTNGVQDGSSRGRDDHDKRREWTEEEIAILKKQLTRNPAGKPGRWEAIAGGLNSRHKVENVIKKAKELGEKKRVGNDDYDQFLKNRKQLEARLVEDQSENSGDGEWGKDSITTVWSSADDVALLNALKAFPKDVPMRWEKVAIAVPGKSKAGCMKRISEPKRDFRSSKAASES